MGLIRARQKGWRVARGSARQQRVLVLGGDCPWHPAWGPCHCQPLLDCPAGLAGDLLCVLFVIFCLRLKAILQRVNALFVSDSLSKASSAVRQPLQACVGTCWGVHTGLRSHGPDRGEPGPRSGRALSPAKTAQPWLAPFPRPPHWVVPGEGQGRTLAAEPRTARAAQGAVFWPREALQPWLVHPFPPPTCSHPGASLRAGPPAWLCLGTSLSWVRKRRRKSVVEEQQPQEAGACCIDTTTTTKRLVP